MFYTGAFGKVFKGIYNGSNRTIDVAIKTLKGKPSCYLSIFMISTELNYLYSC